jgi:hypothetical protein
MTDQKICVNLLRSNLDTCFGFAELAKHQLEVGMRGPAEQTFGCAQCSFGAILRFLNKLGSEEQRSEVQVKLIQLREGLEVLERELDRPKAA